MTLQLYLDDCANDRNLVRELSAASYSVSVPVDAGLSGADDDVHFDHARQTGLVRLTFNPADFIALHRYQPRHPGISVVYRDSDPHRDMLPRDIVRAIGNLLGAGIEIADEVHVLNHWRY